MAVTLTWTPAGSTTFARVPLGGGGFVTDIKFSSDGLTRIHKTDVSPGAYIWSTANNPAGQWESLIVPASMTAAGYVLGNWGEGYNCHDIAFAPSNPSIIYMITPGKPGGNSFLFKSTNRGVTFTKCAVAGFIAHSASDSYRWLGDKSAVNPFDVNDYIWMQNNGSFWRTTDGGATKAQISTAQVPLGTGGAGNMANSVAFDPTTPGVIYLFSSNNGLYRSSNSGAAFTKISGAGTANTTVTQCYRLVVDKFGQVWVTHISGAVTNLWRYASGAWTNITGANDFEWNGIATNPLSASVGANQITVASGGGNISTSLNNGATWSGAYNTAAIRLATDIGWLADCKEDYLSASQIAYDPVVSNRLWVAAGIGVWYTTPPAGATQPTWTELSRGNDELIVQHIVKPPGAARKCIVSVQDRGLFAVNGTNYPARQVHNRSTAIRHGGSIDYCTANPDFIVGVISGGASPDAPTFQHSGWSSDGGATFTEFAVQPEPTLYGGVVCVSATNTDHMIYVPCASGVVKYTTNRGASWTASAFAGGITGATTPHPFGYTGKQIIACSDKTTGDVFYIYNVKASDTSGGLWRSTDGGANFTRMVDDWEVSSSGTSSKLSSVPGKAGHLCWSLGALSPPHPYNPGGATYLTIFRRSTDGGATWTDIANGWDEVHSHGWGMAKPGETYPTVFVSGARTGDTPGIYRSTDQFATWTRLAEDYKTFDHMGTIDGDMQVYGDVWVGTIASGVTKGSLS